MNTLPLTQTEQLQLELRQVREHLQTEFERTGHSPVFRVQTYGCQQNISDTEKLQGLLYEMGYAAATEQREADLVVFNTCAIREHAEDRVFGNIGALKQAKRQNPRMIIAVCGCMTQRPETAEQIRSRYPFVDILFGAGAMEQLPGLLLRKLTGGGRHVELRSPNPEIREDLPSHRDGAVKAWLPIMYGCDNFCTYCVVPIVRGRERSRSPDSILAEARELIESGYKDITLLGQNVNSYGGGLNGQINFSELLRSICKIPGDYRLRFMTSHPKDCTHELIDTIAEHRQICNHLHLPVQSGSNAILTAMNRHYSAEHYKELIDYAKHRVPGMSFTSDIIVGFPGETEEDFCRTLELVEYVRFQALFTFIYSRRSGTKAAAMPDSATREEKIQRMNRLLELQADIGRKQYDAYIGKTVRVLADGEGKTGDGFLCGRTEHNIIVEFPGDPTEIGSYLSVVVRSARSWALIGEKE